MRLESKLGSKRRILPNEESSPIFTRLRDSKRNDRDNSRAMLNKNIYIDISVYPAVSLCPVAPNEFYSFNPKKLCSVNY